MYFAGLSFLDARKSQKTNRVIKPEKSQNVQNFCLLFFDIMEFPSFKNTARFFIICFITLKTFRDARSTPPTPSKIEIFNFKILFKYNLLGVYKYIYIYIYIQLVSRHFMFLLYSYIL